MRILIPILYFVRIKKRSKCIYLLQSVAHATYFSSALEPGILSSSIQWHQSGSRKFALVRVFIHH